MKGMCRVGKASFRGRKGWPATVFPQECNPVTLEEEGRVHPEFPWHPGLQEALADQLLQAVVKCPVAHAYRMAVQAIIEPNQPDCVREAASHLRLLVFHQHSLEDPCAGAREVEGGFHPIREHFDKVLLVLLLDDMDDRLPYDLASLRVHQLSGAGSRPHCLVPGHDLGPFHEGIFRRAIVQPSKVDLGAHFLPV